jgi:hypothetical protein
MLLKHTTDRKVIKKRICIISLSAVEIHSDDHKYDRFVQNGQVTAEGTLESGNYLLTTQWTKEQRKPKRMKTGTN